MSATTGAAMARLLSISVGEMSTCTKRRLWPLRAFAMRQKPVEAGSDQHDHIGLPDREGARRGDRLCMIVG